MTGYARPTTLDEALEIRAAGAVTVLAGGTDIYPHRATRHAWGHMGDPDILDISAIKSLRGIGAREDHWRIGALATWSDLVAADLPGCFDGLKRAARAIGGLQIQNRGTLAGNICNASPAADGTPCLLSLDASVELSGKAGTRVEPLGEFHDGYRSTLCRPDELVTAIMVPKLPDGARSHFIKLGARRYLVISIVMASAVLVPGEDGTIAGARIALGACSVTAQRLTALERRLHGKRLHHRLGECVEQSDFAQFSPIDDARGSADYRRAAAFEVVRDLIGAFGDDGARVRAA